MQVKKTAPGREPRSQTAGCWLPVTLDKIRSLTMLRRSEASEGRMEFPMSWTLLARNPTCSRLAKVAAEEVLGSRQGVSSLGVMAGLLLVSTAGVCVCMCVRAVDTASIHERI